MIYFTVLIIQKKLAKLNTFNRTADTFFVLFITVLSHCSRILVVIVSCSHVLKMTFLVISYLIDSLLNKLDRNVHHDRSLRGSVLN